MSLDSSHLLDERVVARMGQAQVMDLEGNLVEVELRSIAAFRQGPKLCQTQAVHVHLKNGRACLARPCEAYAPVLLWLGTGRIFYGRYTCHGFQVFGCGLFEVPLIEICIEDARCWSVIENIPFPSADGPDLSSERTDVTEPIGGYEENNVSGGAGLVHVDKLGAFHHAINLSRELTAVDLRGSNYWHGPAQSSVTGHISTSGRSIVLRTCNREGLAAVSLQAGRCYLHAHADERQGRLCPGGEGEDSLTT